MSTQNPNTAPPNVNSNSSKKRFPLKDTFIILVIVLLMVFILYSRVHGVPSDQLSGAITSIAGDFVIYLLGILGVFEFGYDNGITFFVPDKFIQHKEESLRRQTKEFLYDFLDRETKFLKAHEKERLADTLSMMGLSAEGYHEVTSKALEASLAPIHDIETTKSKIMDMVFYSDVVCDLSKNASHVNQKNLRYYFRFHDLMHDQTKCLNIVEAMANFIFQTCEQNRIDLTSIDVLMVPHSSNYLLGLEVSRRINKRFIKMIPKEKQIGNYSYEGEIPEENGKTTIDVLMIHDVLLTGAQIYQSANSLIETLPNCKIHGLFSVIYRSVGNGKTVLEHTHNIPCYNLIELTEEQVADELKKRGKA